jgi:hypothetical protein
MIAALMAIAAVATFVTISREVGVPLSTVADAKL